MKAKIEQFSANNPNPVLSVAKDGTVFYSNEAGEPLLNEWGVRIGEKSPSSIGDVVQKVISQNSPEKIEVKAGKKVYLLAFHPLPEEECVNISGFDISDQKEVEGKLRVSENKYRNIVETSVEGIWILNTISETTYVNEKMAEMLGYNREEMIGRFVWDFAYEEDRDIFQVKLANRKQGVDEVYELRLIRKDGSPIWVSVSAKGFFDDAGKFEGSVGMFTDVTDRKGAEEALRESKARVESIFRSSPVGIGVVVNRMIKEANERLCEMTGYLREELLGKSALMLYPTAEEYERVGWIKYGIIAERDTGYVETRWQRKDGSIVYILLSSSPIVLGDLSGEITFTALDITERKRAEEALKKAHDSLEEKVKERTAELEEAYNSLLENKLRLSEAQKIAHLGNWDWNLLTDELYWSDELYRIFGLDPLESSVTYDAFLSHVDPEDRSYVDNATQKALNGDLYRIEYRITLPDGEKRIVHSQGEVIFDEKCSPVLMRGTVQDITESKKAEEKIKIFAHAVESSNVAIMTGTLDGIVTSWNKGAEQIYGYSAEEVIGQKASIIEPDHLKGEIKKFNEKIKRGEKVENYETVRLRKDGTPINVSVALSPVFDDYGRETAISVVVRDITENKRAEEKLRESEEKYRNIVETANEGIFLMNAETKVTYANKRTAEMLGYILDEIIGRSAWNFVSEESKPIAERSLEKRRRGINDSYELKLVCKDGSSLWVFTNAKPFFSKDGEYTGSLSMITDITKRKEAEEALRNFEIARKKEIHHRIKNNLQVISSLLDLQAELFKGRKNIRDSEVLKAFEESMDRVLSIALIHEELYKGKNIDALNFPQYIKELAENLLLTYRLNTDVNLNFDLEENLLFDMDTAIPLGIIINELVSNSLKYAFSGRDKGEIQIKLHREENGECKIEDCKSTNLTLSISDNGVGIPLDLDIENLDSLGLQLVTSLVDQLDGELELKRNNGTDFAIRFTVTEKDNQESVPAPR